MRQTLVLISEEAPVTPGNGMECAVYGLLSFPAQTGLLSPHRETRQADRSMESGS